jgi:hypothetical protein
LLARGRDDEGHECGDDKRGAAPARSGNEACRRRDGYGMANP